MAKVSPTFRWWPEACPGGRRRQKFSQNWQHDRLPQFFDRHVGPSSFAAIAPVMMSAATLVFVVDLILMTVEVEEAAVAAEAVEQAAWISVAVAVAFPPDCRRLLR